MTEEVGQHRGAISLDRAEFAVDKELYVDVLGAKLNRSGEHGDKGPEDAGDLSVLIKEGEGIGHLQRWDTV